MTVIRAALDEMFAVIGQMVGSVFRHGLPLTDKIAARTALTNFFLHIHPVRVRRSWIRMSYTLCLGGLSFFLFIVLTVTGLFLMFYYVPSTSHAYQDMRDLQFVVTFGGVEEDVLHRAAGHPLLLPFRIRGARRHCGRWLHDCLISKVEEVLDQRRVGRREGGTRLAHL